jgi:hypothetical protein
MVFYFIISTDVRYGVSTGNDRYEGKSTTKNPRNSHGVIQQIRIEISHL